MPYSYFVNYKSTFGGLATTRGHPSPTHQPHAPLGQPQACKHQKTRKMSPHSQPQTTSATPSQHTSPVSSRWCIAVAIRRPPRRPRAAAVVVVRPLSPAVYGAAVHLPLRLGVGTGSCLETTGIEHRTAHSLETTWHRTACSL